MNYLIISKQKNISEIEKIMKKIYSKIKSLLSLHGFLSLPNITYYYYPFVTTAGCKGYEINPCFQMNSFLQMLTLNKSVFMTIRQFFCHNDDADDDILQKKFLLKD